MKTFMLAENLQEAIHMLFNREYGRQRRIARELSQAESTISEWANGDTPVHLETIVLIEDMLGEYPVTDFLNQRRLEQRNFTTTGGGSPADCSSAAHPISRTGGGK